MYWKNPIPNRVAIQNEYFKDNNVIFLILLTGILLIIKKIRIKVITKNSFLDPTGIMVIIMLINDCALSVNDTLVP
jgi:hypothetical protein